MKRKRESPKKTAEERKAKILKWTQKRNVKGDPTVYRFLVSYADEIYFVFGRLLSEDLYRLGNLAIQETTVEIKLQGHVVMDLDNPKELTTDDICKRTRWSRYLTTELFDYVVYGQVLHNEEVERVVSNSRTFGDKRAEFYRSIYCKSSSMDDGHSLPDTDSTLNLSLCSGDTEFDVIGPLKHTARDLAKCPDKDDDHDDWHLVDFQLRVYYDAVSFCKAQKLNHQYHEKESTLKELLPHAIHIHVPEIIDHLRLVFCNSILNTKRVEFWRDFFDI